MFIAEISQLQSQVYIVMPSGFSTSMLIQNLNLHKEYNSLHHLWLWVAGLLILYLLKDSSEISRIAISLFNVGECEQEDL